MPTYDVNADAAERGQPGEGQRRPHRRRPRRRRSQTSRPVRRPDGTVSRHDLDEARQARRSAAEATPRVLVRPALRAGAEVRGDHAGRVGLPASRAGSTIPLAQAAPHPVEIDEFLNMFDQPHAHRLSSARLKGFGDGLAGRGADLNQAIAAFRPLLTTSSRWRRNLTAPRTQLDALLPGARPHGRRGRPGRRAAGVALFVNLDTTFTALASVARPFIQETISEAPPTEDVAIRELPQQRPFLENSTALLPASCSPAWRCCPRPRRCWPTRSRPASRTLPKTPPINARARRRVPHARRVRRRTRWCRGRCSASTSTVQSLNPTLDVRHAGADHL